MTQQVIEGTWEEILAQQDKLRGKRVRVTVSPAEHAPHRRKPTRTTLQTTTD